MAHKDMLNMAIEVFLRCCRESGEVPCDFLMPKPGRWDGATLEPKPAYQCQVGYATDGAREMVESFCRGDGTPESVQHSLEFSFRILDEGRALFQVSLMSK